MGNVHGILLFGGSCVVYRQFFQLITEKFKYIVSIKWIIMLKYKGVGKECVLKLT